MPDLYTAVGGGCGAADLQHDISVLASMDLLTSAVWCYELVAITSPKATMLSLHPRYSHGEQNLVSSS